MKERPPESGVDAPSASSRGRRSGKKCLDSHWRQRVTAGGEKAVMANKVNGCSRAHSTRALHKTSAGRLGEISSRMRAGDVAISAFGTNRQVTIPWCSVSMT